MGKTESVLEAADGAGAQCVGVRSEAKKIAIAGFGTVGSSVARILGRLDGRQLRLTHVWNRRIERKKVDWVPPEVVWTESFDDVLGSDVDVVVELIGGLDPAKELVSRALACGKSVVTANKQLIAAHGPELFELARISGQAIAFGASVCGGIPLLPAIEAGLRGDNVVEIKGILNGTCNYILSRIESEKVSFAEALKGAQQLGYAEADPTDDVDGFDARAKLAILARVALRREVSAAAIPCSTIRSIEPVDFIYTRKLGCTIRQISRARVEGSAVSAWVQPTLVPIASPAGTVQGSRNVVITTGEFGGDNVFVGFGAGGDPTAVAIVSDLVNIARNGSLVADGRVAPAEVSTDFDSPYFVRFVINDRPGLLAVLASLFSRHGINIESVLQERGFERHRLPFVIMLESCRASQLKQALADMDELEFLVEKPVALPVLA